MIHGGYRTWFIFDIDTLCRKFPELKFILEFLQIQIEFTVVQQN